MSRDLLIERLFELLICGDREGARELIETALGDGLTIEDLAEEAYAPLVRMINALHRAEQLTSLAHHCATHILSTLIDDSQQPQTTEPSGDIADAAPEVSSATQPDRARICECEIEVNARHSGLLDRSPDTRQRSQFVDFSFRDGVLTAHPSGPSIDAREVPIINTEISDVLSALGPRLRRLVLDLSDVKHISSMALGMCLDLRRAAELLGAQTTTVGTTSEMARAFRRLKIARAPSADSSSRLSSFFSRAFAVA